MTKQQRTIPRQNEISVFSNENGGITIEQKGEYGIEEDSRVYFRKRDVALICRWLHECAKEIDGEL